MIAYVHPKVFRWVASPIDLVSFGRGQPVVGVIVVRSDERRSDAPGRRPPVPEAGCEEDRRLGDVGGAGVVGDLLEVEHGGDAGAVMQDVGGAEVVVHELSTGPPSTAT